MWLRWGGGIGCSGFCVRLQKVLVCFHLKGEVCGGKLFVCRLYGWMRSVCDWVLARMWVFYLWLHGGGVEIGCSGVCMWLV